MSDPLREALCAVVTRYGTAVCVKPEWCRSLLLDRCHHDRRGIENLIEALTAGVPVELLATAEPEFPEPVLQALTERLREGRSLSPAEARWAIDCWAVAVKDLPRQVARGSTEPTVDMSPPLQRLLVGLGIGGLSGLVGGGAMGAALGALLGVIVGGLVGLFSCCAWLPAMLPGAMVGGALGLRVGGACGAGGGFGGGCVGGASGRVSRETWVGCLTGALGGALGGWLLTAILKDFFTEALLGGAQLAPPRPFAVVPAAEVVDGLVVILGVIFGALGGSLGGWWGSRWRYTYARRDPDEEEE